MKIERVLLFVVAAGAAISISNAQSTTSTTTTTTATTTTTTEKVTTTTPAKPAAKTAAAKPAAPVPNTPAELRQLDYFVGSWQCTGKNMANAMGPEKATSARVDVAWELGGHWLVFHYNEAMTTANQAPVSGQEHWGWDPDQKKFVQFWIDNGGGYENESATGWDGDKLAWEGSVHVGMGAAVDGRDTFTKKSASELTHMGELNMKGTWTTMDQEDCKRIKATKTSTKKTR